VNGSEWYAYHSLKLCSSWDSRGFVGKMGSGLERQSWAGGDMLEGVRKRLFEVQKKSQPKHLDKGPMCPDIGEKGRI